MWRGPATRPGPKSPAASFLTTQVEGGILQRSEQMAGKVPAKRKAKGSKASVVAHFVPLLTKPAEVIGDYISMQGKEWPGCPAADKDKWYRCVVRHFEAMHEFGASKSAAFEVQEMGESGDGSLEPGAPTSTYES